MLNYNEFINGGNSERIIATMTSWKKRIGTVANTLYTLTEQTKPLYKIVLNLSTDEFPNKEKELPGNLLEFKEDCPFFEIFWVKENVTFFKKLIPTLKRYPKDLIITTDDDILYNENFVESIYDVYVASGKKHPITCGKYTWNRGINSHFGSGSLVKEEFFGKCLYELYDNVTYPLLKENIQCFDDVLYTYAILLNKQQYVFCDNGLNEQWSELKKIDDGFTKFGNEKQEKEYKNYHLHLMNYIIEKYNLTYSDLCKTCK